MDKFAWRAVLAAPVAAALLIAQPAEAAMACWNQQQTAAAKVRDLQSRLMVAALRCRAMGMDVIVAYDDFIHRNHDALQAANGVIRAQFATGYGKDADLYYDRFATSLANRYGGDATTAAICDETAAALQEGAAAGGDVGKLLVLADRLGPAPELPGGACRITFAAAMDDALAATSDPQAEGEDLPPPRPRH